MKVTEKDLIGDIKDFPIEVVQRMIECQVEQGNVADVSVFQKDNISPVFRDGFSWVDTLEDYDFWDKIINNKNFDLFFQRYPKQEPKPYPKVMLVWSVKDMEELAVERVVFMEKNSKFIAWDAKTLEASEKVCSTSQWSYAQDIPELPEKVTIKEKGIEVGGVELSIEELEYILNELKNK